MNRTRCAFCCGHSSWSTDDEDVDQPMKWCDARHTEAGMKAHNCWACERVFFYEYRPFLNDRKKLPSKLARSLPDRTSFQNKRKKFLKRRRKGQHEFFGQGSSGRKNVKHVISHNDKLIMPEDDFWLLPRYIKQFGDPSSKGNKAKGHRVCRKHGYKGVVVPGDDGEGPWRLQQSVNNALEQHETVVDDNSECSSDHVDNVFETLKEEREADHASVSQGMMKALLAKFVDEREPVDLPKKSKKHKLKKKKGIRATGEASDSSSDSKTRRRTLTRTESNASTWSEDRVMSLRKKKRALGGAGGKAAASSAGSGGGKSVGAKTAGSRGVKGVSVPLLKQAAEDL